MAAIIAAVVITALVAIAVQLARSGGEASRAAARTSPAVRSAPSLGPTAATLPASQHPTARPPRRTFGPGTYRVGRQIEQGTYRWAGATGQQYCGWLRLRQAKGGPSTIIAFNISHGRPLTGIVEPGDHDIQIQGQCRFQRVN